MRGRVDLDTLRVDIGEVPLPPVDNDGAVGIVGGVDGAEDVGGDIWSVADAFVEFGTDGEGRVWHGSACGGAGYDGIEGYSCRTE